MSQESGQNLNVLVEVSRRLGQTFELDELLRTIEQAGRDALGCERATVFLCDHDCQELYSRIATGEKEIRFSNKRGIAGEAARTRSIIVVADTYADPRFNPEIDRKTGYRTRNLLTLPLIAPDGELIGVLQVLNKTGGDFDDNDILLAEALGALTGVAIKRQMLLDEAAVKQRLERELSLAREIQQNLLPAAMPELQGFDIAAWNLPADQTGGDCYDFFKLDHDQLGLTIADATGHGIGPALIVSQTRSVMRALARQYPSPADLMNRLNDLLCEDLPSDRFVTCCLAVLDAEQRQLQYVSAGHGPLLWYTAASGTCRLLDATGVPVGVVPGYGFDCSEMYPFEPGDLFIMLTDGFNEWARPDGEMYGIDRLKRLIHHNRDLSSTELIQCIYRDVHAFSPGSPQLDDLTAVVVKCER